jgi:hypothetical protein
MHKRELESTLLVPRKKALCELVDNVVVLSQELAGDIERDAVWAMPRDDVAEPLGCPIEARVPGGLPPGSLALRPPPGLLEAIGRVDRLG